MIRAVLDTNLLVSYLLTHRPPIATLIDHHLARDDLLLVTAPELLAELDRVPGYSKLQRYCTDEERTHFVALIMALSEVVDLPISSEEEASIPRISRDPDDDMVIACAVVGEADVIVTGDEDPAPDHRLAGHDPGVLVNPPVSFRARAPSESH